MTPEEKKSIVQEVIAEIKNTSGNKVQNATVEQRINMLDYILALSSEAGSPMRKFPAANIETKINVVWDESSNINTYTTAGVYNIKGQRTMSSNEDNLPITNRGGGHTIHARLLVLDSSIESEINSDDKCITQILSMSNRVGGDGNVYIRTGRGYYKNGITWENWAELQTNVNVGQVDSLDTLIDNGIYSGVWTYGSYGSYPLTFVCVVINDYFVGVSPRRVSQFLYGLSKFDGSVLFQTRVGVGDTTIEWGKWKDINEDNTKALINDELSKLLNGTDPDKVDSLKDLIAWVEEHGGEASEMASAIEKNTTDIANEVTRAKAEESRISAEVQYLTTRVIDYSKMYLTFVALEDGLTAKLSRSDCEYCIDGDGWIFLPANTFTAPIYIGQKLSFRCVPQTTLGGVGIFTVTKKYNVEGNIMSLLSGDDFVGNPNFKDNEHQVFNELFRDSETLIDASALVLPAKATTQRCYQAMFARCTSLVNAPQILDTKVGYYSYNNMFAGCTSLAVAPVLQGVTLGDHSYNTMFTNCTNLKYVKAMFTTTPGENYTNNWLSGVAPTGTFVKSKDATWDVRGASGIPEGWTVVEV